MLKRTRGKGASVRMAPTPTSPASTSQIPPSQTLSSQSVKALLGIRELIIGGTFRPGERLPELALVDRLGLSRTPVRAALARLELEGLVEALPSGGYAARGFTDADITDAIELRGLLEGAAARRAAESGVPAADLRAVRDVLARLDEAVDFFSATLDRIETYITLNETFHDMLARMSGSAILAREVERAQALPFATPSAFLDAHAAMDAFPRVLAVAQAQHWGLVEAIESREGARAEALAREHARLARGTLRRVLDDADLKGRVPGLTLVAEDAPRHRRNDKPTTA